MGSGLDPIVIMVPVIWGGTWPVFYLAVGALVLFSIYRLFVRLFPLP